MKTCLSYDITSVVEITNGKLLGDGDTSVNYLSIDSRTLLDPAKTLFFALIGERHNGHSYIEELYRKGVRNFVISQEDIVRKEFSQANFILVYDTLEALHQLSRWHRSRFNYPVIGITGSNGKTIVKEWLFQLLQPDCQIVRSPKSYNSQVGVPLSLWNLYPEASMAIIEAGISQPGEMKKLEAMIQPQGGIFTHLGDAHQENFESTEEKLNEKLELFDHSDWLIYCRDDERIHKAILQRKGSPLDCFTWSRNQEAQLRIRGEIKRGGTTCIRGEFSQRNIEVVLPFTDKASIENAIHCWAYLLREGIEDATIRKRMKKLQPVAMRLEIKEGLGNCTLINDFYNSDLGSLPIALDMLNQQQQKKKKKTLILSDIFQSGISAKELYAEVATLIEQKGVDRLIGIGESISEHAGLFDLERNFYRSTDQFLHDFSRNLFRDEVILIRGARNFHFERISNMLQYKAHRTVLEVNLNAMVHNLNYFRSLLKPETRVVVMVKAFSYGSGSVEVANLLQFQRVDYLAVAIADEGVELRNAGIDVPIMVMNPEYHSFDTMIEYRLEPEIYSLAMLESFETALKRNGVKDFPVHIKFDTGMHRMGFGQAELDQLLQKISGNDQLHIRSVFSHLAGADEEQHDDFTRLQIERFKEWSGKIQTAFPYPVWRHILNSAGIERFPEAQFEMVRLGIGLYGVSSTYQDKLRNVSSLKTTISQIQEVSANGTVGYGRRGLLLRDSRIGIIPIGYADGFNRHLGNGRGSVLVNGVLVPVVGNVCMDMSMIDLTDVEAREGDTVTIFGDEKSLLAMARELDTIPYEILTTVSRRVKRVYFQE
ncbi:MAG: bifunctional UDP-N-acetylmuramoyl-tripeptide:D-alanyl-D-alanine ligase/alanine racemase [Marinifilaceae bacterium]